jgi:GNAT superfamily N-acetyltransferase
LRVRIVQLTRERLQEAAALLDAALPHDRVGLVADEKLFGSNGLRSSQVLGAESDGQLLAVLAAAGRWVKLLAVAAGHRRRGIATALLSQLPDGRLRVMDHPGNYLSPGLDIRYGEARAFFAARGFRALGQVENIRAPLDGNPLLGRSFDVPGYRIRRALPEDEPRLLEWVARSFHPVWSFEVGRALAGPRRAVHIAVQQNSNGIVAFAAADGNNQGLGWFGPAGTDPAHRGRRLGEALLLRCLDDVRGLPEGGVIAWIGPKEFYAKACGAVDDRRFLTLERT